MQEVKSIINVKEFMANGRKYKMIDKLAIERWIQYEKLQPRITFGVGFEELFSNLGKAYAALDKQKFADAAVIIHNTMNGIKNFNDERRAHPALLMAGLFIVREDEDVTKYDEVLMLEKIEDWQKEGLNMLDFFHLSRSAIRGFNQTLIKYAQDQLNEIGEEITK